MTPSLTELSNITPTIMTVTMTNYPAMLTIVMPTVIFAECHEAECHGAECHGAIFIVFWIKKFQSVFRFKENELEKTA